MNGIFVVLVWGLTITFMFLGGVCQVQYAKAGYPSSTKWKLTLFLSGWLPSALLVWAVNPANGWQGFAVGALSIGVLVGWASVFWFPTNMQNLFPKK